MASTHQRYITALQDRIPSTVPNAPTIRSFVAAISHIAYVRGEEVILIDEFGKGKALGEALIESQGNDHMVFHLQGGHVHLNLTNGKYVDISEVLTDGELGVLAREVMRWRNGSSALETCKIHLRTSRDDRETRELDDNGLNAFVSQHVHDHITA